MSIACGRGFSPKIFIMKLGLPDFRRVSWARILDQFMVQSGSSAR